MDSTHPIVPRPNTTAFELIYTIETGLREFIIRELEMAYGPQWHSVRLPSDISDKFLRGYRTEKLVRWTNNVSHHPIYYIDFPELRKIIEENRNWREVFHTYFNRKDIFISTLSQIESVRNKVAHNRIITNSDVDLLSRTLDYLKQTVGEVDFLSLSAKSTQVTSLQDTLRKLVDEVSTMFNIVIQYELPQPFPVWGTVKDSWWWESSYLNTPADNLECVAKYYQLVEEFGKLERVSRAWHRIEAWVSGKPIDDVYQRAQQALDSLLESSVC